MSRYIVDGNLMAMRSRRGVETHLQTSDGRTSTVIYQFLRSLSFEMSKHCFGYWGATVVWDGGHSKYREKLYPDYKKREPDADPEQAAKDKADYFMQTHELHTKFLPSLGIQSIKFPGCEADDIMAILVNQLLTCTSHHILVFSADKDFQQLVSDRVYAIGHKGELITEAKVKERWGVSGPEVAMVRACIGDDSDSIVGIKGIGEKRAAMIAPWIRMVHDGFDVGSGTAGFSKEQLKWLMVAYENRETLARNTELMTLPQSFADPRIDLSDLSLHEQDKILRQMHERPDRNILKFFQHCREWEFKLESDTLFAL